MAGFKIRNSKNNDKIKMTSNCGRPTKWKAKQVIYLFIYFL